MVAIATGSDSNASRPGDAVRRKSRAALAVVTWQSQNQPALIAAGSVNPLRVMKLLYHRQKLVNNTIKRYGQRKNIEINPWRNTNMMEDYMEFNTF